MKPFRSEISQLFHLALPVLVAQLLMASASFVDTLMAGQAGTADLAGVGVGSSLWSVCAMFLVGTFMSINPTVARYSSLGQNELVANYVQQGFWLSVPVALLLFIVLNLNQSYLPWIVEDFAVLTVASGYLQGLSWGVPAIIGFFVLKSFGEGMAYTRAQMVSAAIGLAVNIPANYVLIFGKFGAPELGGAGCGWATSFSFWTMFATLLIYAVRHSAFRSVPLLSSLNSVDWQKIAFLLKVGLPIGLAITIEGSAFALVTLFIAGLPATEIAGHQIAMNISYLAYMVPLSISIAMTVRVASCVAKKDSKRAGVVLGAGLTLALGAGLVLALTIYFFRRQLADLYSNDLQVISIASTLLLYSIGFKIGDSIAAPLQGALRGYHDVNAILGASIVSYWLVCLPLGYVIGLTDWWVPAMGAKGYWISLIAGVSVSALLLMPRFFRVYKAQR